jgi:tripartite-type tricarboxylate transporter receptor subunit TctC
MLRRLTFLLLSAFAASAFAQFPAGPHPVVMVVPYPPGGLGDILVRLMAPKLQESIGVPVMVENKPGANGAIGTGQVARAKPDGHTLAVVPMSTMAINPWLYKDIQYHPKDMTAVMQAISLPNVLVVHPSVPVNNLNELVALMKSKPDALNYASMGQGSSGHLLAELFKLSVKGSGMHVPYKGSGQASQDLLAGKVQMMFENLPIALPHVRAGKLRALGVTSATSSPQAPEIPPISTVIPGFEATIWFAFVGPGGMPKGVTTKLNEQLVRALRDPAIVKAMEDRGATVLGNTADEANRSMMSDYEKWGKVVKEANVSIQ